MILEFSEWIANHKDDVFKCYGEKKAGFKNSCNGDEQSLEHIQMHDLETATKVYKDAKEKEKNKEEKQFKESTEVRLAEQSKELQEIKEMMRQILLKDKTDKDKEENEENNDDSSTAINPKASMDINAIDQSSNILIQQSINQKFSECPTRSKFTTFDSWLKSVLLWNTHTQTLPMYIKMEALKKQLVRTRLMTRTPLMQPSIVLFQMMIVITKIKMELKEQ